MKARATICLFAKPPRPGSAKTRLASAVGDAAAAALAGAFLDDALARFRRVAGARVVLATTETEAPEWRAFPDHERWTQGDGDLGEKIERILRRALAESPIAVAVGADAPDLPLATIEGAISALEGDQDAALAGASDGGFALLALRRCPERLLAGLPWSDRTTGAAARARLAARGLRVRDLDPAADVDEPGDLADLEMRLRRDPALRRELPRTWRTLSELPRGGVARQAAALPPASISVIVPTWNEAARIEAQLEHLEGVAGVEERIVVDGGSSDATAALVARRPRVRLLHSPPGRARQMNAGAAAASGEILLFLHADARLPRDAAERVRRRLGERGIVAGAFRIRTTAEGRRGWIRHFLPIADVRSRYSKLPYGDQAIFLRAATFRAVGGFPDQPLMEDLELSRRLRRLGRIRIDPGVVEVSGRRFFARPIYYPLAINLFPLLYACGVRPATLARLYGDPR